MFESSDDESSILRNESVLSSTHTPNSIVGRENEVDEIVEVLRPLTKNKEVENLLLYGPPGSGKSTCMEYVLKHLGEETRIKPVRINCWKYNTRSSFLAELLIQLGYPAPRKGKPVDELLSKIREWLDKNRGFAVALDEFDRLEEKTQVIYDLQMLNAEADNKVGTIMVSNQHPQKIDLDPRSRSRLNCQTLEFDSYSALQLEGILRKRVEQAFRPGAVPDQVVEEIAERVAAESGDCREALSMLLQAGRQADRNGESEVSPDDL